MFEMFTMRSWIVVAAAASYSATLLFLEAQDLGKLTAFAATGISAISCVAAGFFADRWGKARIAIVAMVISGTSAVLAALTFGGQPGLHSLSSSSGASPLGRIPRSSRRS